MSALKCSQQVKDESFPPLQCTGRAFAKAGSPYPLPWSTLLLPALHGALNKPLSLEQGKWNPSLSQIPLHKHLTNLANCQERLSPNPPTSSQGPHCPPDSISSMSPHVTAAIRLQRAGTHKENV